MYGYIYLGHRLNSIGLEGTYTYGFDRSKASRSFKFFVRTAPMGYGVWQHLERLVYTTAVPVLVQYIPGSIVQAVWTCTCHASNKSSRQHHRSAEWYACSTAPKPDVTAATNHRRHVVPPFSQLEVFAYASEIGAPTYDTRCIFCTRAHRRSHT